MTITAKDVISVLVETRFSKCLRSNPEDVLRRSDYELIRAGRDPKDAKLAAARALLPVGFRRASEAFRRVPEPVSTGCPVIDKVLGGGLQRRCIYEIYGESGCGKTQICLQIAAAARNAGAVYLCTEDAFPSKRLHQFFPPGEDKSRCGEKIFILHLDETEDLIKCITTQLPVLLKTHSSISVVILDSATAPFRGAYQEECSTIDRARHLKEMGTKLIRHAKDFDLAVLCVNQVSSDLSSGLSNATIPCLGLVWSNIVATRMCVSKTHQLIKSESIKKRYESETSENVFLPARELRVVFSPVLPRDTSVSYVIKSDGVYGLA